MALFTPRVLILLLLLLTPTISHNWLTVPLTYNTRYATGECKGMECVNACPEILEPEDMSHTYDRPVTTWQRNQRVKIAWAKNNHHGGLFRLSLLPVPLMHDKAAHAKFAFEFGCWESGLYDCRAAGDDCGTDSSGAYKRTVTVPNVYEDGVYVLGYVWYGGLHFKKELGQFPDFYSCSFVRIQGGGPVAERYAAQWIPGEDSDVKDGLCETSAARVGVCDNDGCSRRRAFRAWAPEFWYGRRPVVTRAMVEQGKRAKTNVAAQLTGICKGEACCPKQCGQCGGPGCSSKPGGGESCCNSAVESARKECGPNMPPCVRDGLPGMGSNKYRMTDIDPKSMPKSPGANGVTNSNSGLPAAGSEPVADEEKPDRRHPSGSSEEPPNEETSSPKGEIKDREGRDPRSQAPTDDGAGGGAVCSGGVCCPASCGRCGGSGCNRRPGGANCCTGQVRRMGRRCDRDPPPCVGTVGGDGVRERPPEICSSNVCCPASCGRCGGGGCHRRPGGGQACCSSVIRRSGRRCENHPAPCVK